MTYKPWYKHALPHWQPGNVPIFITWRLAGSLPTASRAQFNADRERIAQDPRAQDTHTDWLSNQRKQLFKQWDITLHQINYPRWLTQPEIAVLVQNELRHGAEDGLYRLYAYTLMSNHVHVLLHPLEDPGTSQPVPLSRITQLIKGRSARATNQVLGRTGQQFWARESYDHWARNEQETRRIIAYIMNNPVKAGLVNDARDWPWSWATEI